MILQLKIRNYLSFKEEVTFSFEATSDRALDDYYVAEPIPGVRILKMAMVYGANSSGKSNLLKAFSFLWEFFNRIPTEKERSTRFIPFMFDKTKASNFSGFILLMSLIIFIVSFTFKRICRRNYTFSCIIFSRLLFIFF